MKNGMGLLLTIIKMIFFCSLTGYREHLRKAADTLHEQNDQIAYSFTALFESLTLLVSIFLKTLEPSLHNMHKDRAITPQGLAQPHSTRSVTVISPFAAILLTNTISIPLTRLVPLLIPASEKILIPQRNRKPRHKHTRWA
jgi:hypothetical protein